MRILLILLLALFPVTCLAKHKAAIVDDGKCPATPSVKVSGYPGLNNIVNSNNLALPEGKARYAYGQKVYIYGKVLDKNCVPVSDAMVEIWQVNPSGRMVRSTLDDRMDPYPDFTGSGRTFTDNRGRFNFITLFPGLTSLNGAPRIYVRVSHEHFPPLGTEMFFEGDNRNTDDRVLVKMPPQGRHRLMARDNELQHPGDGVAVKWDIVLHGANQYETY